MTENTNTQLDHIIGDLNLVAHVEGGYYSETYRSANNYDTKNGPRASMTSIFYLLTKHSSIGHFHLNRSDIMHYFHQGDPIEYYVISQDGVLTKTLLGPDISAGHQLQFLVKGGNWKASKLNDNSRLGYGLIGEAVAPGFDFQDMKLGKRHELLNRFPQHETVISKLTRSKHTG